MVLIVTNKEDYSADYLILKLRESNIRYFRINSEEIHSISTTTRILGNNFEVIFEYGETELALSEITSVWYRRSLYPILKNVKAENRIFLQGELKDLFAGILLNPSLKWINPLGKTIYAERKLYQLAVASQLGFNLPKTIISNCASSIKTFFKGSKSGQVICKPIFHGRVKGTKTESAIYTSRLCLDNIHEEEFDRFPTYLQEEVNRVYDLRITVVGKKVFPVAIHFDRTNSPDWRPENINCDYELVSIPYELEEKCLSMMDSLGLIYAAFDFIFDTCSKYMFLEVNPTGEYVWLENQLDLPISEALISELCQ